MLTEATDASFGKRNTMIPQCDPRGNVTVLANPISPVTSTA